jgi:hypothetical protein
MVRLLMRDGVVARTTERMAPCQPAQAVVAAPEDAVTDHRLLHEIGATGYIATTACEIRR